VSPSVVFFDVFYVRGVSLAAEVAEEEFAMTDLAVVLRVVM
jgi:hypothetical protein